MDHSAQPECADAETHVPYYSEMETYYLMRIAYILNYDQIDLSKKLRAGSESPGNRHIVYPGFPPLPHVSRGMDLLNSGFDVLPVANSSANLERNCFQDCSGESPINTASPDYGPPSTSPSQISSLADLEEPDSSIHQEPATSTPQESMAEAASLSLSPWSTGGPPKTVSPDYGPPSSPWSDHSSVSKWESRSPALIYNDSTTSSPQGSMPEAQNWPLSPWMTEEYLNEECQPECPKSTIDPNSIWFGGCNGWGGFEKVPGASGFGQPNGLSADGVKNYGYPVPFPGPAKLVGESQAHPVVPASSNTKGPQRICTNRRMTRYEDGEVLRYGAGESYRPFNNGNRDRERSPPPRRARSPLRPRSPIRDRDRDRDLRARTPPIISDSYVPNRSPRRRSRSPDRYRGPDRARDMGGESWRRRDNSRARIRSPIRRISPRRSPRRSPGRFSPGPRRDDRFDRARSPRRDFDIRDR